MKIYNVLVNPLREESVVFIEEGFSFIAFVLQLLWLIYHKTWGAVIAFLSIQAGLGILLKNGLINEFLFSNIQIVVGLIIASFAKTWYMDMLIKNNYQLVLVVAAKNIDEAKIRFYSQQGETNYV